VGFLDEAGRLALEGLALDPHQRERVARIVDRGAHEGLGALLRQAGIGTKDEGDRPGGIRPGDVGLDLGGFQRHHGGPQVPATK
jgi:hypothetical protein